MCVLTTSVVALNPATMLTRLTRNDRLVPRTVSWTRCTVSPSAPAACSNTAACSTPPRACSTSLFRFSVAARISSSNNGSSAFMRTNRYSDSATGFLSCNNSGTSKPATTANAPAPTQRAILTIIKLLRRCQISISRSCEASKPRTVLPEDPESPEDDDHCERHAQQSKNEPFSHDALCSSADSHPQSR